jgi:hypothetical protein
MTQVATIVTSNLGSILAGDDGVSAQLSILEDIGGVSVPPFHAQQVVPQNTSPELAERGSVTKYPILYVYCSKLLNELHEKSRTFSGEGELAVEVRVSQDRIEELETRLHVYVDAVICVLDQNRGDWGDGVFFGGTYEVTYGPVKHGGRNFLQIAKVTFVVEISIN